MQVVLGNHDLHLLAVAAGGQRPHRSDTLDEILASPERPALLDWLRHGKLADMAHGWLLVHAGVVPQWTTSQTLALAAEVQAVLTGPDVADFLRVMYGNQPARWCDTLDGYDRWRMVLNALTRIRYCAPDGTLEFDTKDGSGVAPPGHLAWFDARPANPGPAHRLWPLVHPGPAQPARPAVPGHRLRMGRGTHGRAGRRRPARADPSGLPRGAPTLLMAAGPRHQPPGTRHETRASGKNGCSCHVRPQRCQNFCDHLALRRRARAVEWISLEN